MVVTILYRTGRGTRPEAARIRDYSDRIARHFRQVSAIDWTVAGEPPAARVSCRVRAGRAEYRARAEAMNYQSALDQVLERVVRQRRRAKRMRTRGRRGGDRR